MAICKVKKLWLCEMKQDSWYPSMRTLPVNQIRVHYFVMINTETQRCPFGVTVSHWWPADEPARKMLWRVITFSSMLVFMVVASIFKALGHGQHSGCCQTVYWTGGAATAGNWMSIRPKQFGLIHSTSLNIFTGTDYIWQPVPFRWTQARSLGVLLTGSFHLMPDVYFMSCFLLRVEVHI